MNPDSLQFLFSQLANAAPYLLVYAAAFVCALVLRPRAPGAAFWAALGCAILFGMTLFGSLAVGYAIHMQVSGSVGRQDMTYVLAGISIVRAVGHVVGFVMVFAAVFTGRNRDVQAGRLPPVI